MAVLRLRELRTKRNLSQADIAAYMQIARTTYVRYESGEREMSYDAMISLADYFGVSADYLLGRNKTEILPARDDEAVLLNLYRSLDVRGQRAVLALAGHEYAQVRDGVKKP